MSYTKYEVHVYPNEVKEWYLKGKLHREDGPAVEYPNGRKRWYLNAEQYTELEHKRELIKRKSSCANKIVEIDGVQYKLTVIGS